MFAVLVRLTLIVACIALMTQGRNAKGINDDYLKFIATVRDGHDAHDVARKIERHAMKNTNRWEGNVEHTHAAIGVIIVNGPRGSCQVLQTVDGVEKCEVDSIVTLE